MIDFLGRVLVKAGEKIIKDIKAAGINTIDAFDAAMNEDEDKLEELADKFAENAAVGCAAAAAKKAGLAFVVAAVNDDDIADSIGDALGHINPVVAGVITVNAVMAGVCKVAADKNLQDQLISLISGKPSAAALQRREALLRLREGNEQ